MLHIQTVFVAMKYMSRGKCTVWQINNTLASVNEYIIFYMHTHVCMRTNSLPLSLPQRKVHLLGIKEAVVLYIFIDTLTCKLFSTFYITSAENIIYDL
jgi:hypothetical protein